MSIITDIAFNTSKTGVPDLVKEAYDREIRKIGLKFWHGITKVASTGFGKGVLVVAAITAVAFTGFFALAAAGTAVGFAGGAATGLFTAIGALMHPVGLIGMAVGGTLGAVSDVRRYHNQITAEMAELKAENFAKSREDGLSQQIEQLQQATQNRVMTPEQQQACSNAFTTRETMRREAQANNPYRGL
jgi:hypothetical protein